MKCLRHSMPFAITLLPGMTEPDFFASDKVTNFADDAIPHNWRGFIVSSFGLGKSQAPEGIEKHFSAKELLTMELPDAQSPQVLNGLSIPHKSTPYEDYEKAIRGVIINLAGRKGKTVISRLESINSKVNPLEVAESYFTQFPACFRSLYYTPGKGMWIVATPELLMDYDLAENKLKTMSLAGTRKCGETDWDEKNLKEHELVTDYIAETLKENSMVVKISEAENLRFGKIEHLCNHIEAKGSASPLTLAMNLSPTPAVCGWPVAESFESISKFETHQRGCYGGFIGVAEPAKMVLFVNLRCSQVFKNTEGIYTYNLYGGGGINNMSDPAKEWDETENKMGPLKKLINIDTSIIS